MRGIDWADKVFVGHGSSLDFARRHEWLFDEILDADTERLHELPEEIAGRFDFGVVVMDHGLAFQVAHAGRPLYFFDSLLGFWVLERPVGELVAFAEELVATPNGEAWRRFLELPVHEREVVCHCLARCSYAQNFVGVAERVRELHGHEQLHVEILGPIVWLDQSQEAPARRMAEQEIVVNLGGVQNFLIEFGRNDYYVDLTERWARDHLRRCGDSRRVLLCSGRYLDPITENHGTGILERALLEHPRFLARVAGSDAYLSAAGLTAIAEAALLGRLPALVPEQHYGHYDNLDKLAGTPLAGSALRWADVVGPLRMPSDDMAGSELLVETARRVLQSPDLYDVFCAGMDRLVAEQLDRTGGWAAAAAARQVVPLFGGASLQDALAAIRAAELEESEARSV